MGWKEKSTLSPQESSSGHRVTHKYGVPTGFGNWAFLPARLLGRGNLCGMPQGWDDPLG